MFDPKEMMLAAQACAEELRIQLPRCSSGWRGSDGLIGGKGTEGSPVTVTRKEAVECRPCRHFDAWMCASIRYGRWDETHLDVEPCGCGCHEGPYDDEQDDDVENELEMQSRWIQEGS